MTLPIIDELHEYCRRHLSFNELADKLQWSRALLADFFAGKDTTLTTVIKVAHAMDLTIDVKVTSNDKSNDQFSENESCCA